MLYSLYPTYYNEGMDEKQMSIHDIQRIMGTSYPTALKFATAHGEMINGRWRVPSDAVQEAVDSEMRRAETMEHELRIYKTEPQP